MKQTAHHVPADSFSQQKGSRLQTPLVFICLRDCLSKSYVYVSISCSQHRRTMLKDTLMGAKTHCHSCTVRPPFNCVLPGVTKRTRTTPAASLYPSLPPTPQKEEETHESCGNRGGRPNSPYGFGGRKATLNLNCQKVIVIDVCCCCF